MHCLEKRYQGTMEESGRGIREKGHDGGTFKSWKGFGFGAKQARARPSNAAIWDLPSEDRDTDAVLAFLEATRVETKDGVTCR